MGRHKTFDPETALDSAIGVFREHGFEGTSADMLVQAMGVGRQSLYDTFGDKWGLYCAAVRRYALGEQSAHLAALSSGARAMDGLDAMMRRVVREASLPCLGVGSIWEFGQSHADLSQIHTFVGESLRAAIAARVRQAQDEGDISPDLDAQGAAEFLIASFAGIRVAARGGAGPAQLEALADFALRALR